MSSPATVVRSRQGDRARRHGLFVDSAGYTGSLDDNLFVPLSPETRAKFSGGDGGELGRYGKRDSMQALHSSSALTCNVFEYRRARDAGAGAGPIVPYERGLRGDQDG